MFSIASPCPKKTFLGEQRLEVRFARLSVTVPDQNLYVHFEIGVQVAAEMAALEIESAVGQFIGEPAAGEADLLVERGQRRSLPSGMVKRREGRYELGARVAGR